MDFCTCRDEVKELILPVAMAMVPVQSWETPYDGEKGLSQGTIFPCLDLPFYVTEMGGGRHG